MMEKEKWKIIDGFDNYYEVSNLGNVRSWKNNRYGRSNKPKMLTPALMPYPQVTLWKNKSYKSYTIHRLVAKTFIPNPENKRAVNHKNGIKTDNRLENLEWVTYKENTHHARKIGLLNPPHGDRCASSKLTPEEVISIRKEYSETGMTQYELGDKYGVRQDSISRIVNYKTWTQI